jgi:hypothetical protein
MLLIIFVTLLAHIPVLVLTQTRAWKSTCTWITLRKHCTRRTARPFYDDILMPTYLATILPSAWWLTLQVSSPSCVTRASTRALRLLDPSLVLKSVRYALSLDTTNSGWRLVMGTKRSPVKNSIPSRLDHSFRRCTGNHRALRKCTIYGKRGPACSRKSKRRAIWRNTTTSSMALK